MKNLAYLRQQKGFSQQKLGDTIGLARNTICQYESGRRVPDVDTLIKLAQYFHVSTDYLLGLTDEPDNAQTQKMSSVLSEDKKQLLAAYDSLSPERRQDVLTMVKSLISDK